MRQVAPNAATFSFALNHQKLRSVRQRQDHEGRRPIYHQCEQRIEAHIFVAFLAYRLHVTLRARLFGGGSGSG
jgi:hypothetical protein